MNERISALMDGEVDEPELARDLAQLRSNGDLRRNWDTYHLIGDTLRGHVAPALAAKVSQRLAGEPTVLAPQRRAPRRKIARLAAAGVAAVALVAWLALQVPKPEPQQVAASAPRGAPAAAPAAAVTPVAVGVENYLLAHQSFSPAGAMQGVAPYVRTVADERGGRGK